METIAISLSFLKWPNCVAKESLVFQTQMLSKLHLENFLSNFDLHSSALLSQKCRFICQTTFFISEKMTQLTCFFFKNSQTLDSWSKSLTFKAMSEVLKRCLNHNETLNQQNQSENSRPNLQMGVNLEYVFGYLSVRQLPCPRQCQFQARRKEGDVNHPVYDKMSLNWMLNYKFCSVMLYVSKLRTLLIIMTKCDSQRITVVDVKQWSEFTLDPLLHKRGATSYITASEPHSSGLTSPITPFAQERHHQPYKPYNGF